MRWLDRLLGREQAGGPREKAASVAIHGSELVSLTAPTPRVTGPATAVGIPAVLSAMRVIVETGAMLPQLVYRDGPQGVRERAIDADAYELLHRRPSSDHTPVEWRSDMLASLVGYGHATAEKIKVGGRLVELLPLDPRHVRPEWSAGALIFHVADAEGRERTLTRADVLHVRGYTLHGEARGLSPVTACRLALSSGLSMEDFLVGFWRNDAKPGGLLEIPGTVTQEEAEGILDRWNETHRGADNAGKTGLLTGGAKWTSVGMSLVDAQFVETHRFTVEQAARIFNMPPSFLGAGTVTPADVAFFEKFTLGPYTARLDAAVTADRDLCPLGSGLFSETLTDALLRPATRERFEAYRAARQGGWITPNEIRRLENYPPVKGGDEIQETPVGGAPNRRPADAPDGAATDGGTDA